MEFIQVPGRLKEQLVSWLADWLEEYLPGDAVAKH